MLVLDRLNQCQLKAVSYIHLAVYKRQVQRLRANESRYVGILTMHQWHETILRKLRFAAVTNGDFRGAFQVDAAIIGGKAVRWQICDDATGLNAAN